MWIDESFDPAVEPVQVPTPQFGDWFGFPHLLEYERMHALRVFLFKGH